MQNPDWPVAVEEGDGTAMPEERRFFAVNAEDDRQAQRRAALQSAGRYDRAIVSLAEEAAQRCQRARADHEDISGRASVHLESWEAARPLQRRLQFEAIDERVAEGRGQQQSFLQVPQDYLDRLG